MINDFQKIKELYYNIFTSQEIENLISDRKIIKLKGKRPVLIGTNCMLKVNTNVGVSDVLDYNCEVEKLKKLCNVSYRPDSIMDLSIIKTDKPLWNLLVDEFDGAIGTIPYYTNFDNEKGINEEAFWCDLLEMLECGISFMTLHPTADINLYNRSRAVNSKRLIPTTSRGGYILLKDQVIKNRKENFISANFDKLMQMFSDYKVAVSIGSVFRPATIYDAMDSFQIEEIGLQKKYIDIAGQYNVPVIMEGLGHITFDKIIDYVNLIRDYNIPLMTLGPIPSDETIGFDHISNALGAIMLAQTGVLGMMNSVTREEHTGEVPSFDSVIEGLKTAYATAHCYNISRFDNYKIKTESTAINRALNSTCVQSGGIFNFEGLNCLNKKNCSRCKHECPLNRI